VFGQTFEPHDLVLIALLVLLEGVLSIDNALVLALLAKRLPKPLQARALTYGLVGAFIFRFIAIGGAAYLLRWRIVKLIGGGYLLWVALKHLILERGEKSEDRLEVGPDGQPMLVAAETGAALESEREEQEIDARSAIRVRRPEHPGFWATVAVIEMTDIAFAIDSILAAIAVVGPAPDGHKVHPQLWVVVTGGMLGVVLMRVAASMFIRLLERYPRFEISAYLLVCAIGLKLLADWGFNSEEHPDQLNFHDPASPAFWIFWLAMAACIAFGFSPQKKGRATR